MMADKGSVSRLLDKEIKYVSERVCVCKCICAYKNLCMHVCVLIHIHVQEPVSLYNDVRVVPLSKLDRLASQATIKHCVEEEEAK